MGASMFEKVIFVDEKDVSEALELIKGIKYLADDDIEDNNDTNEGPITQPKQRRNRNKIIFIVMAAMIIIPFISMLIFFMMEMSP